MSHPLRRMVSSSQVSDWFTMGGTLSIPSRNLLLSVESLVIAGGGGGGRATKDPRIEALIVASGLVKSMLESNQITPAQVSDQLNAMFNICYKAITEEFTGLPF